MIPEEVIQEVVAVIVRRLAPRRVILFGSRARGEAMADSDLDLFIEMDVPSGEGRRAARVRAALGEFPIPMDIVVYTPEEVQHWSQAAASLVSTVLREGRVLYDAGGS